jgi:RNA-directed DNA polymerase
MENKTQIAEQIRQAFYQMKDKDDLVKVVNLAKLAIFGDSAKEIPLKTLTYYANPNLAKNRYAVFYISKKSGGRRTIHAPVPGLNAILKCLNFIFQCVFEEHFDTAATGFTPGKSVVDNAKVHTGKSYVLNLDLKDFFPSIDLHRVT